MDHAVELGKGMNVEHQRLCKKMKTNCISRCLNIDTNDLFSCGLMFMVFQNLLGKNKAK